jgi:putative FmdB family regulatory protein
MHNYEFICNACKKAFSKSMHLAERESEKPSCPHCGSHDVEQQLYAFAAVTSRKS